MANALLIGLDEKQAISDLIAKATANPVSLERVKALAQVRADGQETTEEFHDFTINLPVGWSVCYTHEHQQQALCRHISISNKRNKHHEAIWAEIMREFGFVNMPGKLPGWESHDPAGNFIAEFIEPLDGNVALLRRPT